MDKNIVYVIELGMGKVDVCSTRFGDSYARKMANGNPIEIKERLGSYDELGGLRTKWLAFYLKQDYLVANSKAEQSLARKLWLGGERKKHPGNAASLKPKKGLTEAQKFVRDNL